MVVRNIVANLIGRGAAVALNVLLLPVYLWLLGVESVGLIGFYGTLATIFGALEHNIGAIVMREIAKSADDAEAVRRQRDFLRTTEVFYGVIALGIGALITAAAPHVAHYWSSSSTLSSSTIQSCVVLMGWAVVLQLGVGLHLSMLNGLERQIRSNLLSTGLIAARGIAAVIVLFAVAATSEAYFVSQFVVMAVGLATSFIVVWRTIPSDSRRPGIYPSLLSGAWSQARILTGAAILFVILIQADRLIVSTMLSLDTLGHYVLASSIAGVTFSFYGAIAIALVPRFTKLLAGRTDGDVIKLFHVGSQFASFMLLPVTIIFVFRGEALLFLWTGNPSASANASGTLALLSIGALLNSLPCVSYSMQLAAGLVHFSFYAKLLSLPALPLAYFAVLRWGASGATLVWIFMGTIHLLVPPILLHRQLLRSERTRWYVYDLGVPTLVAFAMGLITWLTFEMPQSRLAIGVQLLLIWIATSMVVLAVCPDLWRLSRQRFIRPLIG